MKEKNKIFFGTKGITSTSANHIANIAKEVMEESRALLENSTFVNWAKKYSVYDISSNYISFNDNTIKEKSKEIFVTNYGERKI